MDTYKIVSFSDHKMPQAQFILILFFPISPKQANTLQLKCNVVNKIYLNFVTACNKLLGLAVE
jgi:hypothetical protein